MQSAFFVIHILFLYSHVRVRVSIRVRVKRKKQRSFRRKTIFVYQREDKKKRKKKRKKEKGKKKKEKRQQIEEEDKILSRKTVAIPYIKGTSGAIRRVLAPLGVRTAFKSNNRKWTLMGRARHRQTVNRVWFTRLVVLTAKYVGETARTGKERLKEHKCHTRMGKSELSAIAHHVQETQHQIH